MLELIADHRHRCGLLVVGMEDGMTGSDQRFGAIAHIEWHREHEALRLDKMLFDRPLVPDLVHRMFVVLAEVVSVGIAKAFTQLQ